MKRILFLFILCAFTTTFTFAKSSYKNANLSPEKRAKLLLKEMSLEEKLGQMTQICRDKATTNIISVYCLGSVLSGGGSAPTPNTDESWRNMINDYQKAALSTRLGIPILYGTDAVHGHNNLQDATIFPHNIGLGATGDLALVEQIGKAVAEETKATGITWTFAPCVAVLEEPRWGRCYECFGSDTDSVTKMSTAFINGFQSIDGMLCTAKHFLGDGGTTYKSYIKCDRVVDQGDTRCTEEYLRERYLPPYIDAIKNGVRIVMPSFSSWNGLRMHANKYLLTDVLKKELGFTGFVVSDWAGMDMITKDYYTAIVKCINAGVDMNMVPYDAGKFINTVKKAIEKKDISMKRINDAVYRILLVKFESGLFEHPYIDDSYSSTVRSQEHLDLARKAVQESVVVLKNDNNLLPLKKNQEIYLCGNGADDIGIQCGGWTISWQGHFGNITAGTTIKEALSQTCKVNYDSQGLFDKCDRSKTCVLVISENPYAEYVGDSRKMKTPEKDVEVYNNIKDQFDNIIVVTMSGRPFLMGDISNTADAIVAAWLPGSEGGLGIADVLTGRVKPTGKLPVDWPETIMQVPFANISSDNQPLYKRGTGLSW